MRKRLLPCSTMRHSNGEATRQFKYILLDVFTQKRFEGNPLAVFPAAAGISDFDMQRIAGELNLSETVFLFEPTTSKAAAKARIFTPRRELPFAGHPTVGSAYVINRRTAQSMPFFIEENVGLIRIDADADDADNPIFWLTTPKITFFETVDPSFCARLLGLSRDDIHSGILPQFVSAGSPFLFICLNTPQDVDRAAIQNDLLGDALGSVDSVGTFIFARKEPQSDSCFDVYSRMFAYQTGIPEDPATGGATGPLAAYMLSSGVLPPTDRLQFTSEQGTKMGRRSLLHVRVGAKNGDLSIKVGGSAVMTAEGVFQLD
jgi:trans-2,3-dihydro-3-hydroxyanthranilate isomerase